MDVPPPIPPRPPGYELRAPTNPALPARPNPQQQQSYHQSPPLPQTGRPPSGQQYTYGGPPQSQGPPPQNARSQYPTNGQQQQQQQQQPSQWSALHHPDGAPTPLFKQLMAAIFGHLDPQRTGYIRPEVLSNFLDLIEFPTDENLWKRELKGNFLFAPEDIADAELKLSCEAWRFDHKVITRFPGRTQFPGGGMPLLSLQGFTDLMAVEHAAGEPDRSHRGLNAAIARFGIWPHLGPMPRHGGILLEEMPPQVRRRLELATERARREANDRLEAARVQGQIQARGREAALALLDPPYVRREYRYY